uniref:Helicase ATP-binding domain-containing protein n=1 Tax=viral metagenome TaxID=1070528 RepID=A0A6C0F8B5_9ZZZZ|tara:strand:+ start:15511 stop:16284 length:774 start_codon:yes stop_codon:yes gene_type:complete
MSTKFKDHCKAVRNSFQNGKNKLLFHSLGNDKIVSSLLAAKHLYHSKKVKKIFIVTPVKEKFIKIFKPLFVGNVIPKAFKIINCKNFLKIVNKNILHNTLVIIDQVQDIVCENKLLYEKLFNLLVTNAPKSLYIILLTTLPKFIKTKQIILVINLLGYKKHLPISIIHKTQKYNTTNFIHTLKPYINIFLVPSNSRRLMPIKPISKQLKLKPTSVKSKKNVKYMTVNEISQLAEHYRSTLLPKIKKLQKYNLKKTNV